VPFAVLALTGLAGLIYVRGDTVPRYVLLCGMLGLVMFFITARYRMTFAPLMCAMGAAGVSAMFSGPRRHWVYIVPALVIVGLPFHVRDQRPVDHYNVAVQLISLDRDDEALRVVERGLAIDPNYPELHFAKGNVLFKSGRFTEAAAEYEVAVAANPNHPTASFNLALSIARSGDYCRARDVLAKMRAANVPLDERAWRLRQELEAACANR
jgi:tetratricopeptide (TPR) repeat protein